MPGLSGLSNHNCERSRRRFSLLGMGEPPEFHVPRIYTRIYIGRSGPRVSGAKAVYAPALRSASTMRAGLDGGDDGRRRWDGAALAGALDAERIERVRRLHVLDVAGRHVERRRQEIVLKGRRQRLRISIVLHPLEQRIADAMGDAALHLAVDDQGIDDVAAVVGDAVTQER